MHDGTEGEATDPDSIAMARKRGNMAGSIAGAVLVALVSSALTLAVGYALGYVDVDKGVVAPLFALGEPAFSSRMLALSIVSAAIIVGYFVVLNAWSVARTVRSERAHEARRIADATLLWIEQEETRLAEQPRAEVAASANLVPR
jgi:ABC-type Na+ efflux pump permease subunit